MVRITMKYGGAENEESIHQYNEAVDVSFWEGFLCVKNKEGKVIVGFSSMLVEKFEIIEDE
jgi:hypothetical protein